MNLEDPLAQLRDIHLPQAVGWWPPALGWWLLMFLLIAGLGYLARRVSLHRRRSAYRRSGERELQELFARWESAGDTRTFLQQLNALLKRVALHSFPGADVAAMSGARWTRFLDQQRGAGSDPAFSGGPLEFGPYAPTLDRIDVQALRHSSLRWLREHREALSD